MPDAAGGPSNPEGKLNAKAGQPAGSGLIKRELSANVYRVDPDGRIDMVASEEAIGSFPNGIAFSPDFKKVYIVARGGVVAADVAGGKPLARIKPFSNCVVYGVRC